MPHQFADGVLIRAGFTEPRFERVAAVVNPETELELVDCLIMLSIDQ